MGARRALPLAVIITVLVASLAAARAEDKTPIRLGVLHSSLFSVIHAVAQQRGYYARAGLEPTVREFRSGDGSAGLEAALRGDLDAYIGTLVEITRVDSAAIASGKGAPLAVVAAGVPGITTLVLRKDIPYSSPQDLKGLRIGVSSPGTNHLVIFRYFLGEKGLTTESIGMKLIRVGGSDMPSALLTNQIDGFLHSEPTVSTAIAKANAKIVLGGSDLGIAGQSPNLSVNVRRDWMQKHRDVTQRLVRALEDASRDYRSIPKSEMLKIFSNYEHADDDVLALAYDHLDPRLFNLRQMMEAYWTVSVAAMKQRGEVGDNLKPEDVFDLSFSRM
jgi:NitT/TauT family transport system substrate-binding protein